MARKPQLGPMIPFGPYLPDLPTFGGGCRAATNVIPHPLGGGGIGYEPFPDVTVYSSALTARCQGAISVQNPDGVVSSFAGDATKLYIAADASWTNATGATTLACPADGQWRFAQFGETVIAVDGEAVPQKFALGSTTFAVLGGSPPVGEDVAVVRDFVVMSTGRVLTWSAINNCEGWTAGTNQSDTQTLAGDGTIIQRVIGGEFGSVLCRGVVYRMDYVGAPVIFQITRIEDARGCLAKNSAVKRGRLVYYLADDGFYRFDGIQSVPIGKNRYDSTFLDKVDAGYHDRIWGVAHPSKPLIVWCAPITGNIAGNANLLVIYNEVTDSFSEVDLSTSAAATGVELIWRDQSKGYTIDTLDSVTSDIDALPFSLDSTQWTGGVPALAAFNASHKTVYFTGDNLAATIETTEAQLSPGMVSYIDTVRPIVDTTSVTCSVGYRDRQADTETWTTAADIEETGEAPIGASGRYVRARMTLAAGATWTHAQGFDAEATPDGER